MYNLLKATILALILAFGSIQPGSPLYPVRMTVENKVADEATETQPQQMEFAQEQADETQRRAATATPSAIMAVTIAVQVGTATTKVSRKESTPLSQITRATAPAATATVMTAPAAAVTRTVEARKIAAPMAIAATIEVVMAMRMAVPAVTAVVVTRTAVAMMTAAPMVVAAAIEVVMALRMAVPAVTAVVVTRTVVAMMTAAPMAIAAATRVMEAITVAATVADVIRTAAITKRSAPLATVTPPYLSWPETGRRFLVVIRPFLLLSKSGCKSVLGLRNGQILRPQL
jgi:hypothetical protein